MSLKTSSTTEDSHDDLKWVESDFMPQTILERGMIKMKQNPFVPLGVLLTVGALTNGIRQFAKGNSRQSQMMMRYRVGFQAATILSIFIGVLVQSVKK